MLSITIKEIKDFYRDKTNLFFFLLFPVLMVFLLGNLLGGMDQSEEAIGELRIRYILDTKDPYQVRAIRNFIEGAGENVSMIFEETDDLNESKELAGKDEITAVVVFSADPLEIDIYEGSDRIKNRTVFAIMNGFTQTNHAISTVMQTNPASLAELTISREEYIRQKDLGVKRTMVDYYAITMIAMISFFSSLVGAGAFMGERQSKTINRLIIAPQNRVILFFQKILGMVPQVMLQIAIIMLVSVFLFKANYAADPVDNIVLFLMFLLVSFCMISIGAVIGILVKVNPMVVIMPVIWIIMFLGGTYAKDFYIKGLTEAMPVYGIQRAAFDLAIFGRYEKAREVIIVCLLIMGAALALGAFLFSRKEEER